MNNSIKFLNSKLLLRVFFEFDSKNTNKYCNQSNAYNNKFV